MTELLAAALLASLESRHGLTLPERETLLPHVRVLGIAPREAAFRQGERCSDVFVVRSGLFKQVYLEADGRERIKSFADPGELFACPVAIGRDAPTTFASIAIEAGIVEHIGFAHIEALAERHLAWQKALRLVFQHLAELKTRREHDLLTFTPRELYRQIVERAPQWIGRVPQKDLAGYLGVTPVGLNRIVRDAMASD